MARKPKVPSRLIRTPADERAAERGYTFEQRAADVVAQFSREFCRHSSGRWAGVSFELLPWEFTDVVEPLYGWKRPDGTRRHRRGSIWVPKKNSKTQLNAMLSAYHLVGDGEQGAVVGNVAVDREQAALTFDRRRRWCASRRSCRACSTSSTAGQRSCIRHPAPSCLC